MTLENQDEKYQIAVEDTFAIFEENRNLPSGQYLLLEPDHLKLICELVPKYLEKDRQVIEVKAPIHVVGDIHAQYTYLWKFLKDYEKGNKYLFLGDYVDRGNNSIECATLLFCLKMLYPEKFYLIRGNHETRDMTQIYGFHDECIQRFGDEVGEQVYQAFITAFEFLPLAAVICDSLSHPTKKIFCVHGGLAPKFKSISQLKKVKLPLRIEEEGLGEDVKFIRDILWSDPSDKTEKYAENEVRAGAYMFGIEAVKEFYKKNGVDGLFRAHQVVTTGYDYPFRKKYENDSVLTIFSSPNYCDELRNDGIMVNLKKDMTFSFTTISTSLFSI